MRSLFAADPIPQTRDEEAHQRARAEKNYRSMVELQRELKKAHKHMLSSRAYVTKICNNFIVKQRAAPDSPGIIALRNAVRALKGKNLL